MQNMASTVPICGRSKTVTSAVSRLSVMAKHPDAEQALGSIRLEGGDVGPDIERLGDGVASGQMTGDEAVAQLDALHRVHTGR